MYRGEESCHICEAETRTACPSCGKGVCSEHKLASRLDAEGRAAEHLQRIATRLGGPDACLACAELEAEAARGPCVTIYRSGDPIQVQMLVEGLLDAGYDAKALGTQSGALLGAGQLIFDQRIEVPDKQAAEAAALVEALVDSKGGEAGEADTEEEVEDELAEQQAGRRWVTTAGTILVGALAVLTVASVLIRC